MTARDPRVGPPPPRIPTAHRTQKTKMYKRIRSRSRSCLPSVRPTRALYFESPLSTPSLRSVSRSQPTHRATLDTKKASDSLCQELCSASSVRNKRVQLFDIDPRAAYSVPLCREFWSECTQACAWNERLSAHGEVEVFCPFLDFFQQFAASVKQSARCCSVNARASSRRHCSFQAT